MDGADSCRPPVVLDGVTVARYPGCSTPDAHVHRVTRVLEPEVENIKSGPRLHLDRTELPGVGTDLVPPSHRRGKDPSGGGEGRGGSVGGGGAPVEVNVLVPAGDGSGSALGAGAEIDISNHDLIVGSGCYGRSSNCIRQVLSSLNLSYQVGDLEILGIIC